MRLRFTLRGYDPLQVDAALATAAEAARSEFESVRAAAAQALRDTEFRVVMRGYFREEVDDLLTALAGRRAPAIRDLDGGG